ncbi:MAG: flagellar basal body-associated FliL family protein [Desulfobia sp.]
MAPKNVKNGDNDQEDLFPEEFGDDLSKDWENAFKADEFTFSPDEVSEDFFMPEEKGKEDIDLSSLTETKPEQAPTPSESEKEKKSSLDLALWQKLCLASIPLLLLAAALLFFFPRSTPSPPQKQAKTEKKSEKKALPAEDRKKQAFHSLPDKKIRKRYNLPPIFVTAASGNDETAFASVDITLVVRLAPDQALIERERMKASDVIYQFFKNQPAEELEDFALNRGKMIQEIKKWVRQNWPDGPLTSVIIKSYRFDKS